MPLLQVLPSGRDGSRNKGTHVYAGTTLGGRLRGIEKYAERCVPMEMELAASL